MVAEVAHALRSPYTSRGTFNCVSLTIIKVTCLTHVNHKPECCYKIDYLNEWVKHYTVTLRRHLTRSVPHMYNEFLLKLWNAGITGQLWRFFAAYISDCKQYATINEAISSLINVTSGVPQGSILGPLMFLVYINDITSVPTALHLFLYADDGKFRTFSHNFSSSCKRRLCFSYSTMYCSRQSGGQTSLNTLCF